MAYIYDLADTWNAIGTTFTGIKLNVTDSASAAGSLLMDLQVGGESRFSVAKQTVTVNNGRFQINVQAGISSDGISIAATNAGAGARLTFSEGLQFGNQGTFDVILRRDAANALAQRNGTVAQTKRLYGTYTNDTNYERGYFTTDTNGLTIGHEALGTGIKRPVRIVGPSLTAAETVSILDMSQMWNTTGAPTGIKLNITDTASATGSLLMDLQVGGVSRFSVDKTGFLTIVSPSGSPATSGMGPDSSYRGTYLRNAGANCLIYTVSETRLRAGGAFSWSPDATFPETNSDLRLYRDAANTLAQRNGTAAQALHIYNSYSSDTIYERGFMRWVGNVLQIGAEAAGTGTGRSVFISPGGAASQTVSVATVGFQSFDLRYNATPYIEFRKYAGGGTTGWVTNASDMHYRWTASNTAIAEGDVGIKRDSAGVLKITNGNNAATGTGQLIFIVPTTNPGITGALWNNAGTLSISA